MKKRLLSILLCLVMALSLMPISASAEEGFDFRDLPAGGVTSITVPAGDYDTGVAARDAFILYWGENIKTDGDFVLIDYFDGDVNGYHMSEVIVENDVISASDSGFSDPDTIFYDINDPNSIYDWWINGTFALDSCTVTFDPKGGSAIDDVTFTDATFGELPTPERDGYVFDGWYAQDYQEQDRVDYFYDGAIADAYVLRLSNLPEAVGPTPGFEDGNVIDFDVVFTGTVPTNLDVNDYDISSNYYTIKNNEISGSIKFTDSMQEGGWQYGGNCLTFVDIATNDRYGDQSVSYAIKYFRVFPSSNQKVTAETAVPSEQNITLYAGWTKNVESAPTPITEVTVLNFESPIPGKTAGELSNLRVPDGAHYTLDPDLRDNNRSHWIEYNESALKNDDTFAAGVFYMEGAWLVADEGYYFANDCTFTALDQNGSPKQTRSGDTGVHVESNIYAYMWTAYERSDTPPTIYNVWVSGTQVTSVNKDDVLGDGKVSYDPESKKLTVAEGANITGNHDGAMIYTTDTGKLTIDGNLTLNGGSDVLYGVYSPYGNTEITGNADITVAKTNAAAIYANEITVDGSAKLTAAGNCWYALYAKTGNIIVGGDVEIKTSGEGSFTNGLYADIGNITVSGDMTAAVASTALQAGAGITVTGDVDATHTATNNDPLISAGTGGVKISGKAMLTATGNCSYAIFTSRGDIEIDSDATVTGPFAYGLFADNGSVKMTDGKWDISAAEMAIRGLSGITIPETHKITTPADGKIEKITVNAGSSITFKYSTVTASDGTTAAKRAVIKPTIAPTTATITITKSFIGIADDDRPINTATFTVTSSDGTVYDSAAVGDRAFAGTPAAGQFVWKLNDVPAGAYTITETDYDVDGYSCTVTYMVGTGDEQEGDAATATVAAGDDLVITFVDTYTETVTVTFEMNGHGKQVEAQTVDSGEKATKPDKPTAKGYRFGGWYADEKCRTKFDFDAPITANTTAYAKWTKISSGSTTPTDTTAPKTADGSNMLLWTVLTLMSGAALCGAAAVSRKRKYN